MTTCNQAKYKAILKGLQLLQEVKADAIEIFGDSQLIINQLIGLYECKDDILRYYYMKCWDLIDEFPMVTIKNVLRAQNQEANWLAQSSSSYWQIQEVFNSEIVIDD
jgi:ribonuclease HI